MSGDQENLPAESEAVAELAKPEDVTAYVEDRQEQERDDAPPEDETDRLAKEVRDRHPELKEAKKASRYERLKRARDQYKQEAEELRAKLGGEQEPRTEQRQEASSDVGAMENSLKFAHEKHGDKFEAAYQAFVEHVQATGDQAAYQQVISAADPGAAMVEWFEQGGASQTPQAQDPYQAALEQGRQHTNFEAALAEREDQIRLDTEVKFRAQEFAKAYPDFHEAIEGVNGIDTIPAPMLDMMRRSEFGPAIAYWLAKDAWEGDGTIFELQNLEGNPIGQAQLVGRMEQAVRNGFNQSNAPQRATKAPPPLRPVKGGANAPKDIHSLAKSDDAGDYIRARRGNA